MSAIYDNWERLVAAVLKKDQLWQLFHEQSRSPSIRSDASDFSSSSDLGSPIHDLDFDLSSLGVPSEPQKAPPKLVLVSDFGAAFDVNGAGFGYVMLGRGVFGSTYAATMKNGVTVVVRRLNSVNISDLEFKLHMKIVGNVGHENVAALRAYYSSQDERLMLYDYYSNGSVFALLHGQTGKDRARVDWETRLKTAIGAARGIAEIHTQNGGNLIHGNIKASNIFLNPQHYGCVSDLGLTSIVASTFTPNSWCYAPEVKSSQDASQPSDVYSFGILLLELITRKSPVDVPGGPKGVDLVKFVNSIKSKVRTSTVFDADLWTIHPIRKHLGNMLEIGIRCVAKSIRKRPKMSEVVKMLEDLQMIKPESSMMEPKSNFRSAQKIVFFENDNNTFDLEDVLRASAEVLGKGTFGTSYKAILESEDIIMVKRLKDVSATFEEFNQHMEIIGKVRHINVDKFMGYYYSRDEKLMLYDYKNQGSLSALLHDKQATNWRPLDWERRLKIAVGAANGIAHIHRQVDGKLVHGNIKSSNIFLNGQKYGLVADAGLAQMMKPMRRSAMRALGHFAPEVRDSSKASQASDIYSFGVVLLQLVSGKLSQHTTEDGSVTSLVEWVRSVTSVEWMAQVFDVELLRCQTRVEAMVQLLQIAMDCVNIVPQHRPLMSQVVTMLEGISGMEFSEMETSEIEINEMDTGEELSIESRLEDLLEELLHGLTP